MQYHQYLQLQTTQQAEFRAGVCRGLAKDPDFLTLIHIYFESLAPNHMLVGKDFEVDQYRRGCYRDAIDDFYQFITAESEPSDVNEG